MLLEYLQKSAAAKAAYPPFVAKSEQLQAVVKKLSPNDPAGMERSARELAFLIGDIIIETLVFKHKK
ncbi:hypothetical protein D3C87_1976680 [compost metagenome]